MAGLDCVQRDDSLIGPDGKMGWSIENGSVCVEGVEALVSEPAVQWGFEVGVNLNQTKDGVPMAYDASKLKGFAVEIRGYQPSQLRFEVQTNDGADEHFSTVAVPGDAKVRFGTLIQSDTTQNPFDPTRVTSLALHPMPSSIEVTHYAFCIANLRAL